MKVAVLFDRFGPYHIARLEAAANYMDVIPIEISGETSEYQWDKVESKKLPNRITLFTTKESPLISPKELDAAISKQLSLLKPDCVAINGWSDRAALCALYWCLENKIPAILMSESAAQDERRSFWKELLKKKIVEQFSSGLVGGERHADYLVQLGMKREKIFLGYDVVDNDYFFTGVTEVKKQEDFWRKKKELPENYFLVVSRFIEKKNLPFIIKAFNEYQKKAGSASWHLYILGNGILEKQLLQLTNDLGLNDIVHFEGFKQYDELPVYFGLAKALLHGSTTEQWGLVVNEAMASGLPVIISENCGCVPELVHNGVNGFSFNPYNHEQVSSILYSFANINDNEIEEMGQQSLRIVSSFNADAFGKGMLKAVETAKRKKNIQGLSLTMKLILRTLIHR